MTPHNASPMIRPILTSLLILFIAITHAGAEAVPVKIMPGVGITRGGEPYLVKGAAGDKHLDELVATGGNSIRTWTTNGLGPILEAAQQRGLTVCAGIWLEPECNWFTYANADHCAKQTARVKKEVGDDIAKQINRAYLLALSRAPTADELRETKPIIRQHGIATLCRALFNSNEFLFIP